MHGCSYSEKINIKGTPERLHPEFLVGLCRSGLLFHGNTARLTHIEHISAECEISQKLRVRES